MILFAFYKEINTHKVVLKTMKQKETISEVLRTLKKRISTVEKGIYFNLITELYSKLRILF